MAAKDDAVDLPVEYGLDGLRLAGRVATGFEQQDNVLCLLGRGERPADQAAGEPGCRHVIGNDGDGPGLVGSECACCEVGPIAKLPGGGVHLGMRFG